MRVTAWCVLLGAALLFRRAPLGAAIGVMLVAGVLWGGAARGARCRTARALHTLGTRAPPLDLGTARWVLRGVAERRAPAAPTRPARALCGGHERDAGVRLAARFSRAGGPLGGDARGARH